MALNVVSALCVLGGVVLTYPFAFKSNYSEVFNIWLTRGDDSPKKRVANHVLKTPCIQRAAFFFYLFVFFFGRFLEHALGTFFEQVCEHIVEHVFKHVFGRIF